MKNGLKKFALISALMCTGSLAYASESVELNLQVLQQASDNSVIDRVVAFEQDVLKSIYQLVHTRTGDEHFNRTKFPAQVVEFKKMIDEFDASGLEQEVKDLLAQDNLSDETREALENFLSLIANRTRVYGLLQKCVRTGNTWQLLQDLKPYINWLPEEYRLAVVNNDGAKKAELEARLGERVYNM